MFCACWVVPPYNIKFAYRNIPQREPLSRDILAVSAQNYKANLALILYYSLLLLSYTKKEK